MKYVIVKSNKSPVPHFEQISTLGIPVPNGARVFVSKGFFRKSESERLALILSAGRTFERDQSRMNDFLARKESLRVRLLGGRAGAVEMHSFPVEDATVFTDSFLDTLVK